MSSDYFDYIIIGSGLAGLNCALNASKKGTVLVLTKKHLNDCNTNYAQGGMATVLAKTDSFQKHIKDTLVAGHYHNNLKAVELIVKNGPKAIRKLIKLGVNFSKNQENKIELSMEGGHQHHRIVHSGDTTGKAIEEALISRVRANQNQTHNQKNHQITILENCFAKDLLVKEKTCYGVQVICKGKIKNYYSQKTILASGGLGQVYEKTTNPEVATGDGIAMCYRAGCKLKDLEFIQFHPTALNFKISPLFLLSEALRGEGAHLINKKNERFMLKIHPLAELAPRDIVSKVISEQEKKGPIYLDLRVIDPKILKRKYPYIIKKLESLKLKPFKNPIPITPAAHYSCGGVLTDLNGKTNLKNLYAFGEVTCTGLHGANRLASNSLLEAMVMSDQITKSSLKKRISIKRNQFNSPIPTYQKQKSTKNIRKQIQKTMWQYVGISRTTKDLKTALIKFKNLNKELDSSLKISTIDTESQETKNILTTAILITQAALKRKKSLGSHQIET